MVSYVQSVLNIINTFTMSWVPGVSFLLWVLSSTTLHYAWYTVCWVWKLVVYLSTPRKDNFLERFRMWVCQLSLASIYTPRKLADSQNGRFWLFNWMFTKEFIIFEALNSILSLVFDTFIDKTTLLLNLHIIDRPLTKNQSCNASNSLHSSTSTCADWSCAVCILIQQGESL